MKKIMVLLSLLVVVPSAWGESGYTTGNMLKLRKKPSANSVAIEAYPKGEVLNVIDRCEGGKWVKVKITTDGRVGYMFAQYVATGGQPEATELENAGAQDIPAVHFSLSSPGEGTPSAQVPLTEEQKSKVVSLVEREGEGDFKVRFEETTKQLSAAREEVVSLKQEVEKLKAELAGSKSSMSEFKQRLAAVEQIDDFRLVSLVNAKGEEVQFNGLGTVRMAENNGRVIFKVPDILAGKAKSIFAKVKRNLLESPHAVYITIDKDFLAMSTSRS